MGALTTYYSNGVPIQISNVSGSWNTSTTNLKSSNSVITGNTYNSNYSYMKRAFSDSYFRDSGNSINIAKQGYVVGGTLLAEIYTTAEACTYPQFSKNSDGSKTVNGINISTAKNTDGFHEVFYLVAVGGGGSGSVGGRTSAGGGGGSGAYLHGYLDFSKFSKMQLEVSGPALGASGRGASGKNGNAIKFGTEMNSWFVTLGGGGGGSGSATAGSAGSASINTNTLDNYMSYYSYGSGRSGNNPGALASWTVLGNREYNSVTWDRWHGQNGGSGAGSGGRAGACSILSGGGNGSSALTQSADAGFGAGSGGTNYHLTKTPANTGKGGCGCIQLYI